MYSKLNTSIRTVFHKREITQAMSHVANCVCAVCFITISKSDFSPRLFSLIYQCENFRTENLLAVMIIYRKDQRP